MSAKSGGVIQSAGGGQIITRCLLNTTPNPTTSNYHTVDGTGTELS